MVFNVFLYFIFDLILRCFENLKIDLTVRCLENSPNKCYKQINTEDAINLELMMIIYLFYVLQWSTMHCFNNSTFHLESQLGNQMIKEAQK